MTKIKNFFLPIVGGTVARAAVNFGLKRLAVVAATAGAATAGGTALIVTSSTAPPTTFGVDFGWGGPSVPAMHAAGAKFGASYLSYDISKNWQPAQVAAYHAAGIATVNVWETTALRATQGFAAGHADAFAAVVKSIYQGEPRTRPIYFAVDCDCSGGQVAAYFDGVRSNVGTQPIGVYGSYRVVKYLFDTHRVTYGWQTYAWSGGQWDSRAQLRQYSNGHLVGGRDVDYDQGVKADYGQWGGPVVVPKPKPDPYAIYDKTRRHLARGVVASEYNTVATWDRARCRNPVRRSVCRSSRYHLDLLDGRLRRILANDPTCIATFGSCPTKQGLALYHRGARERGLHRRLVQR